jgi:hypothetical protein
MKFPRAISRVRWLSGEQTNVSKTLRTRTEMVFETLVCSPFNYLTRLIARENFIIILIKSSAAGSVLRQFIQICIVIIFPYI